MSKQTPGPWSTDEADHDEPYQDIKIKAGKHRTICTVWIDDAPVRDFNSEQTVNARLIAAAPDLLEVLEHIRRCIPTGGFVQIHDGSATVADMDVAITKAKGLAK